MGSWVCPSDRQLALRARLGTGWSTFSQANQRRANSKLSNDEMDHVFRVIQRNEAVSERENERVESMLKRFENMKLTSTPKGKMVCGLCGQEFHILTAKSSSNNCADCGRLVCFRCSMEFTEDVVTPKHQAAVEREKDIEPSRYLPPNTSNPRVASVERTNTKKLWKNRQLSDQDDETSNGYGKRNKRTKFHSFSLERPSGLASILHLPHSLYNNTLHPKKPGKFYLCKICCEAREVWKRSGAWFHKSLPKFAMNSCPTSPVCLLGNNGCDSKYNSLRAHSPTELVSIATASSYSQPSSNPDDWTRIEKRQAEPILNAERKISHGNGELDGGKPNIPGVGQIQNIVHKVSTSQTRQESDHSAATQATGNSHSLKENEGTDIVKSTSGSYFSLEKPKSQVPTITKGSSGMQDSSKVQILFPEASIGNRIGGSFDPPMLPVDQSDLKFRKDVRISRKPGISVTEAPLGILYFAVNHDVVNTELHIRIHNAKNLIAMDANGLSDPFVVCQLLPAAGKRFRTRTIPQNLNPIWNESFTFTDFDNRKLEKRILRFAVLDEDIFGADWLGEYRLGLGELLPDRLSEFAVPLNPRKPLPKEIDDLANPTRGKIQIGLRFIEESKQLLVEILRCADLVPMDHNGSSDPFVKLYLRPDKLRKTKQKTKVKKCTLFPEFHEQFFYAMEASDVNRRTLEITVWDFDRGVINDFIGGLTLGAKAKAERREVWQAVFRPPYRRFEAWFQLALNSDINSETNECTSLATPGVCD